MQTGRESRPSHQVGCDLDVSDETTAERTMRAGGLRGQCI